MNYNFKNVICKRVEVQLKKQDKHTLFDIYSKLKLFVDKNVIEQVKINESKDDNTTILTHPGLSGGIPYTTCIYCRKEFDKDNLQHSEDCMGGNFYTLILTEEGKEQFSKEIRDAKLDTSKNISYFQLFPRPGIQVLFNYKTVISNSVKFKMYTTPILGTCYTKPFEKGILTNIDIKISRDGYYNFYITGTACYDDPDCKNFEYPKTFAKNTIKFLIDKEIIKTNSPIKPIVTLIDTISPVTTFPTYSDKKLILDISKVYQDISEVLKNKADVEMLKKRHVKIKYNGDYTKTVLIVPSGTLRLYLSSQNISSKPKHDLTESDLEQFLDELKGLFTSLEWFDGDERYVLPHKLIEKKEIQTKKSKLCSRLRTVNGKKLQTPRTICKITSKSTKSKDYNVYRPVPYSFQGTPPTRYTILEPFGKKFKGYYYPCCKKITYSDKLKKKLRKLGFLIDVNSSPKDKLEHLLTSLNHVDMNADKYHTDNINNKFDTAITKMIKGGDKNVTAQNMLNEIAYGFPKDETEAKKYDIENGVDNVAATLALDGISPDSRIRKGLLEMSKLQLLNIIKTYINRLNDDAMNPIIGSVFYFKVIHSDTIDKSTRSTRQKEEMIISTVKVQLPFQIGNANQFKFKFKHNHAIVANKYYKFNVNYFKHETDENDIVYYLNCYQPFHFIQPIVPYDTIDDETELSNTNLWKQIEEEIIMVSDCDDLLKFN